MEIEDAKRLWERDDARLELRINIARIERVCLGRADTAMKRLFRELTVELVLDAVLVVLLGAFIGDHRRELRFSIPAMIFDAYAIASLVGIVRQLIAIQMIDISAPITGVQHKLESLRVLRLRTVQSVLFVAPLMWPPLLIVALRGLFSVDAYARLGAPFLIVNALFGLFVLGFGMFAARQYAGRVGGSPVLHAIAALITGRDLARAKRLLTEIARFEGAEESSALAARPR